MKWLASKTIRNTLQLGGGTALGQFVVIAATPVITRQYTPAALGLVSVFTAFISFTSVAVGLRYEAAIPSAVSDEEADILLASTILSSIPVALFATLVMLAMIVGHVLNYQVLPVWSVIPAFVILIVTGLFAAFRYWHVRTANFVDISRAMVSQGVARALIPVAIGLVNPSWVGLLAGEIGGRTFGILRLFKGTGARLKAVLRTDRYNDILEVMKKHKRMPFILTPSSLIDALASAIPFPIISYCFGLEAAGLFMLSQRIVNIPAGLISASVADVVHNRVADIHKETPKEMVAFLGNTARKLLLAGMAVYVPTAILAPLLSVKIFGSKWEGVGIIITIMTPGIVAGLVASPLNRTLIVINRVEQKLWYDFINIALTITVFVVVQLCHGNFLWAMAALSLEQTFIYTFYYFLIRHEASRKTKHAIAV